ncbi:hypothetical protein [Salinibacter ruber]|uniref:hypothetical protein n=1 Tax=Salinibacter ruber TaxID=146919 RepID=UPI002167B733|nr:hypothetical protein [Salinibacter ruber]MCS3651815.1 hypothetical protein [Salinibacter ruber]
MSRDVGALGERTVATWCSQAGMAVNSSDEDKRGWYHLIEFTLTDEETEITGAPPDRDFREVKSFVQVKSTDSQGERVSIKLSNWKYLTTGTHHPCFILRLEFDGEDEPQRAYLIHVGEGLIEKVLKRLREVSGEDTQLHETYMSVTYGEEESLENESGHALRAAIVETIAGNPIRYKEWKRSHLTEVGYEGATLRVQGHAEVPSDYEGSPEEFIADLSAGLQSSIDLEVDEAQDLRFDDPTTLSSFPDQIRLNHKPETEKVKLIFSAGRYTRERITVDLYRPDEFIKEVPDGKRKIRFSMAGADLILAEGNQPLILNMKLPTEATLPLADLQPVAKLVLFLQEMYDKDQQFTVEVRDLTETSSGDGKHEIVRLSGSNFQPKATLEMLAHRIRNAWKVWKDLDMQGQVEMTVPHILENWEEYCLLKKAFRSEEVPVSLEYGLYKTYEEIYGTATPTVAIPHPFILEAATHGLIAGLVLIGEPEALGKKEGLHHYELVAKDTEIVYSDTFLKDAETPFNDVMEIRELCAERMEDESIFVHITTPPDEYHPK